MGISFAASQRLRYDRLFRFFYGGRYSNCSDFPPGSPKDQPMEAPSLDSRLSQISTLWTALRNAHADSPDAASTRQRLLMERYCGAVYRYLLGALRDQDAAEELFQEFATRFLRGEFRRADPERGRFRDYVKTALIHLVTDYYRAQRKAPRSLPAHLADRPQRSEAELGEAFLGGWREELLNRAWEALKAANETYYLVLLSHVEQSDLSAAERGQQLSAKLGRSFSSGSIRVNLHRARAQFAQLLVDEIAHSLGNPTHDELVAELGELNLLKLCAAAVARRSSQ
jgi:RNA polymerase sigma factor (sigma-70 family)